MTHEFDSATAPYDSAAEPIAYVDRYAGVVLLDQANNVLLQRRTHDPHIANPGRLSLFGGMAKVCESFRHAACRELREELNLFASRSELSQLIVAGKNEDDGSYTNCRAFVLQTRIEPSSLKLMEGEAIESLPLNSALADHRLTPFAREAVEAVVQRNL